jgi:uncharacterized membrane protein YeaQ/YmgE (transglycosylase-associated protein family)
LPQAEVRRMREYERKWGVMPGKTPQPEDGENARRIYFSHRDLPSMNGDRVRHLIADYKESVMGIIAWIVLGLAAGLLANMLVPGRRSQGHILACIVGIAGAVAGGWAATMIFDIHSPQGFFNLTTWITAVVGAGSRNGRERPPGSRRSAGYFSTGQGRCARLMGIAARSRLPVARRSPA